MCKTPLMCLQVDQQNKTSNKKLKLQNIWCVRSPASRCDDGEHLESARGGCSHSSKKHEVSSKEKQQPSSLDRFIWTKH